MKLWDENFFVIDSHEFFLIKAFNIDQLARNDEEIHKIWKSSDPEYKGRKFCSQKIEHKKFLITLEEINHDIYDVTFWGSLNGQQKKDRELSAKQLNDCYKKYVTRYFRGAVNAKAKVSVSWENRVSCTFGIKLIFRISMKYIFMDCVDNLLLY